MESDLSLPVLWAEPGGTSVPGRLDLRAEELELDGGAGAARRTLEIRLGDIVSVRIGRRSHERLGGRPTLMLELRGGGTVSVAALGGLGALHDLGEQLWTRTGTGPEPAPEGA